MFPTFTCNTQAQTKTLHIHNMSFSFGFSGDDIEEDPNDVVPQAQEQNTPGADVPPPIEARAHDLDELVSTSSNTVICSCKAMHDVISENTTNIM